MARRCAFLFSLPIVCGSADDQNCSIAFVFASESEAHDFYKKVANRSKYASTSTVLETATLLTLSQSQRRQEGEGSDAHEEEQEVSWREDRQVDDFRTCELRQLD